MRDPRRGAGRPTWDAASTWAIGTPDVIVNLGDVRVEAVAPDGRVQKL